LSSPPRPQGGFERRRGPLVERVDGLHVVVAVDQGRRRVGAGLEPLAVDGRVPLRRQDLDVVEAGGDHPLGAPLGRDVDVAVVARLGADRRDPDPAGQRVEHGVALGGEEVAEDRGRRTDHRTQG
jgi:hypothetical protein